MMFSLMFSPKLQQQWRSRRSRRWRFLRQSSILKELLHLHLRDLPRTRTRLPQVSRTPVFPPQSFQQNRSGKKPSFWFFKVPGEQFSFQDSVVTVLLPAQWPCLSFSVTEQVEMLEARRKQYMKAALQAKQKNDMEQARVYLRTAKSFEPLITAARSGKHVDLSKVRKTTPTSYNRLTPHNGDGGMDG